MKAAFPVSLAASLFLVPVLVPVTACNGDDSDDTVFEASRSSRISNFADEVCDRYEACEGFGDGKTYQDEGSCEGDWENRAGQAWPVEQCNDRQIDSNKYQSCLDQVKAYACATGGAKLADGITAITQCNASAVCTDAAD